MKINSTVAFSSKNIELTANIDVSEKKKEKKYKDL